jgi:hypothetical protein
MPAIPYEKCNVPVLVRLTQSELKALEDDRNGRSLAAVVRDWLGLEPVAPGRRWPENPDDRRLRTRERDAA